jgi:hypothetical protein
MREAISEQNELDQAASLNGFLFHIENGADIFLRNVDLLSTSCAGLYAGRGKSSK